MPKEVWRIIRRDPVHLPERLVMLAQDRLAQTTWDWGRATLERDREAAPADIIAGISPQLERFARINGALAGTPFLIALVPAYVSVLWQEARMVMGIAALNGRNPTEPEFAGELLALRGLYPSPEAAMERLARLDAADDPSTAEVAPTGLLARLGSWADLVRRVLILAGFISGSSGQAGDRSRIRTAASLFAAGVIYLITWIVPVTFMILMSWSCERDVRDLCDRASEWYGENRNERARRFSLRALRTRDESKLTVTRGLLALMSLAVPMFLIFAAVADPLAHAALYALSSLIGLTVVLALAAKAARVSRPDGY